MNLSLTPSGRLRAEIAFSAHLRRLTPAERWALVIRLPRYLSQPPPRRVWWYVRPDGGRVRL